MKRFEQPHIHNQIQLLISELETITASPYNRIEELAEAQGVTALDVWREICAEAGLDECTPWEGFPAMPTNLPDAPGGSRKLPEAAQRLFEEMPRPWRRN
jgi:hypothetical protein